MDNDQVAVGLLKAPGVGHQISQRNGLAESRTYLEIKIFVYVGIYVELSLLFKLHDRRPGKQLGNGCQPEHRRIRVYRFFGLQIGIAVALQQKHLAVLHHQHRSACNVRALQLERENSVEEGLKVGRFQSVPAGWSHRRGLFTCTLLWRRRRFGLHGGGLSDKWQKKGKRKNRHSEKSHALLRIAECAPL